MMKWLVNVLVKGWVEATKFVTTGGTSAQFVKGDGSLDATSYSTQADIDTSIDDIEIGGRNYWGNGDFTNTVTMINSNNPSFSFIEDSRALFGKRVFKAESPGTYTGWYTQTELNLIEGETYTWSFYVWIDSEWDGSQIARTERLSSGVIYIREDGYERDKWNKIEVTFINEWSTGLNGVRLLFYPSGVSQGYLLFDGVKLEKGNKATDWTPAPEDQVSDWNQSDINALDYIKNKITKLTQLTNDLGNYGGFLVAADISGKADKTTNMIAGVGLTGGGTLASNRTFNVQYGTIANTAAQGNDSRIVNGQTAFTWGNHASAGYSTQTLTAGANITITGSTIAAKDTTYSVFSAAADGLVPKRIGAVATKYLREDGAWVTPTNTNTTYTTGITSDLTTPTTGIKVWSGSVLSSWVTSLGYITDYTETDPTVPAHVKAITTTNISTWNTTAGWGNHAIQGYLKVADIAGKADKTTQIIAGVGLTGGGTLASNRTLNVSYGTTAGTAAQGNDSRIDNGQTAYSSIGLPLSNLTTTDKSNLVNAINEVKGSVPNVTGFVPYTGANQPVNLNTQDLTTGGYTNRLHSYFERINLASDSESLGFNFKLLTNVAAALIGNASGQLSDIIITLPITSTTNWQAEIDILRAGYRTTLNIGGYRNTNVERFVNAVHGDISDILEVKYGRIGDSTVLIIKRSSSSIDKLQVNISKFYYHHSSSANLYNDKTKYKVEYIDEADLVGFTLNGTITNEQFTRDSYLWNKGDFTQTDIINWNTSFGWGNHAGKYLSNTIADLGYVEIFSGDLNTLPNGSYVQAISGTSTNGASGIGIPRSLISFGARSSSDSILQSDILIGTEGFAVRNRTNNTWRTAWHTGNFNPANYALVSQLPTVNDGQLSLATGTGLSGSATFTANQSGGSTFSVTVASTHKLPTTAEWNALSTQTLSNSTSNLIVSNAVQRAALTGDVTAAQNSNATTIATSAVTHAKYQDVATNTFIGRVLTGTGSVTALSVAQMKTALGIPASYTTGTVTSIATGTGLTGGTITASGTIALNAASIASLGKADTALQSFTELDPTVPSYVKAITSANITNWNTAFTNNHTHANKAVLDGITSANVTSWTGKINDAGNGLVRPSGTNSLAIGDITYSGTGFVNGITVTANGITVTRAATPNQTYDVYSGSTAGLVKARDAGATTTKYLNESGNWVVPPNQKYTAGTLANITSANATAMIWSGSVLSTWMTANGVAKMVAANSPTSIVDGTAIGDGSVHLNIVQGGAVTSSNKIIGASGASVRATGGVIFIYPPTSVTPTLQQVTTEGAISTNNIIVGAYPSKYSAMTNENVSVVDGARTTLLFSQGLFHNDGTGGRNMFFPKFTGGNSIVMPATVNGIFANNTGDIPLKSDLIILNASGTYTSPIILKNFHTRLISDSGVAPISPTPSFSLTDADIGKEVSITNLAGTNQPPVSGVAMYNRVVMPSSIYTRQYVSAGQWAKTVVQKSPDGVFYLLIVERGTV